MKKTQIYRILFLVSFWVSAALFMVTYERVAIVQDLRSLYGFDSLAYDLTGVLPAIALVALIGSIVVASFDVLVLSRMLRRRPLGVTLALKTFFYLSNILVFVSIAIVLAMSQRIGESPLHPRVILLYVNYLLSPRMVMVLLYWGFAVALGLFVLEVNDKFGQGVLLNLLRGRYHSPREEIRIFMFLDLTSSTTYAESLGHFKYSRLLQDCFFDLTDVVIRNHAEVYQYVGDEVVLSWRVDTGVKEHRCVSTFFDFQDVLRSRADYYNNTYDVLPEFKAGLNLGKVTVAEVGEIKKELAYHGDALNTAARVRSLCNPTQERFLVTDALLKVIPDLESSFDVEALGKSHLRGRNKSVELFSIRPRSDQSPASAGDVRSVQMGAAVTG